MFKTIKKSTFQTILNSSVELRSDTIFKRFFKPDFRNSTDSEYLACETIHSTLPNYARVKNVDNKWKYLAQMNRKVSQKIQVILCKNADKPCINDEDNPNGKGNTLCKQLFSTQKLLVLDKFGNVTVDNIQIPSACLCHTISGTTSLRLGEISFLPLSPKLCKTKDASKSLNNDKFKIENEENFPDPMLDDFNVTSVKPCSGNKEGTICSEKDPDYPELKIKATFQKHGFFANKEYFDRLFGKPCIFETSKDSLSIRTGLNFEETQVCTSLEIFSYPNKGKTIHGEWKYIVNTDNYQQGILIHKCTNQSVKKSCKYVGAVGHFPNATECKQIYKNHSFLSINSDGSIEFDDYEIPVACACHILDKSLFNEFK